MRNRVRYNAYGFSLAELLVVLGIISLLVAVVLPPIQLARRQAMDAVCAGQLNQHGASLAQVSTEFNYYPVWDDGVGPSPYTWIDLLVQRHVLRSTRTGYCPLDERPDPLNEARARARGFVYPTRPGRGGIDYSYGIGVPLSAGGWAWNFTPGDDRPRRFEGHYAFPARRVLAADSNWSQIYNLSGDGQTTGIWNDPSWYDNTVAWRHRNQTANILYQDGHVLRGHFDRGNPKRQVDTNQTFVWAPDEPLHAGPDTQIGANFYPNATPPSFQTTPKGDVFPNELLPYYYTVKQEWTVIDHKTPGVPDTGP